MSISKFEVPIATLKQEFDDAVNVSRSLDDLKDAIDRFVAETNADPVPFVWTAKPKRVLAAIKRGKEKLEPIH